MSLYQTSHPIPLSNAHDLKTENITTSPIKHTAEHGGYAFRGLVISSFLCFSLWIMTIWLALHYLKSPH